MTPPAQTQTNISIRQTQTYVRGLQQWNKNAENFNHGVNT